LVHTFSIYPSLPSDWSILKLKTERFLGWIRAYRRRGTARRTRCRSCGNQRTPFLRHSGECTSHQRVPTQTHTMKPTNRHTNPRSPEHFWSLFWSLLITFLVTFGHFRSLFGHFWSHCWSLSVTFLVTFGHFLVTFFVTLGHADPGSVREGWLMSIPTQINISLALLPNPRPDSRPSPSPKTPTRHHPETLRHSADEE
jgi:hypothetical protein